MAYEVGLVVGKNTNEPFTIIKILNKDETRQHWCVEQGKNYPHDKAYEIELKCGKTYKTLNTQITKCIQRGWGWNKCKGCNGHKENCGMDEPLSHAVSRIPNRGDIVHAGEIFGDFKAIDFAFNAKRHNYWEFECVNCGAHSFRLPTNVKDFDDQHCTACTDVKYKGPRAIKEYLDAHGVKYKMEYRFDDCAHRSALPFDFAVFYPTGELKCLIEFDGEQHYKFIKLWHGDEEGFKLQQVRDKIKTDYCKSKGIKLIRIPYWNYDKIEDILKENMVF